MRTLSNEEKNYYMKKKRSLMRTFDGAIMIAQDVLVNFFGEEKVMLLKSSARADFEMLLSQIPYVGGKENRLTESLVNSAILLPLLRIFENEGLDFEAIGKLTCDIFDAFYNFIPQADNIFSSEYIEKEKERAKDSKTRKYAGDWVYDFIESDDKTFTFGTDFHECGVHKFYKSQGLEHLMPIICVADFAQARAHGYGLFRSQTIGNGAPICDFRYVKDGDAPPAWPLEDLPEFQKK